MVVGDFELRHWRPPTRPKSIVIPDSLHLDPLTTPPPSSNGGYTSLAELITSPPSTAANSPSATEIRIRNRLVKHAAYAYLQPTPSSTETRRRRRCCRLCSLRRALAAVGSCFSWLLNLIRMDS